MHILCKNCRLYNQLSFSITAGRRAIDNTQGFLLSRIRSAVASNPQIEGEKPKLASPKTKKSPKPKRDPNSPQKPTCEPTTEEPEEKRETSK